VLDTWFSSWLWPIEVFKGITQPNNAEINYYYPTAVLVTGQDIIFFWVARMVMAGMAYQQAIPFKDVYFTGMVRDKLGRKMSKSLGNSPDLLALIDQYGADAVRFGIMIAAPAGNDLLFDEASLEQGKHFNNKLWNALKLVHMWDAKQSDSLANEADTLAMQWFESRLNETKNTLQLLLQQFRLSEALKTLYTLIWDDFCSWYLEWVKPATIGASIAQPVYHQTVHFFTELLHCLHPFMPFITEELYHLLTPRTDDLCIKQFTPIGSINANTLALGQLLKTTITGIRDLRNKHQLKPKEAIQLHIHTATQNDYKIIDQLLAKQVNASSIKYTNDTVPQAVSIVLGKDKLYIEVEQPINSTHEKEALKKEQQYLQGFLAAVEKKLSNQRFVENAKPEVVALEKKKKADAEAKLKVIEESLSQHNSTS
jgi:valyl-tRNA synthetase